MIDIDVIVPVGGRTDDLAVLHRRRREALHTAGYRHRVEFRSDRPVLPVTRQERKAEEIRVKPAGG